MNFYKKDKSNQIKLSLKDKRTVKPVVKAADFKVEFGVNTSFVQ
jgi:hypothetical protein